MPSTADAFYTKGSIGRTMFKTALAMLAGTVAMTGYNLVDTYFVGRLPGQIPLAAIGYTFPIVMLMGCVFRGLATGVMTSSATAIGAGDRKQAVRLVTNGLILVGLVSIAIAIIGVWTLALTAFVALWLAGLIVWQVFVVALPVSILVYMILICAFHRRRYLQHVIAAFVLSLFVAAYLLAYPRYHPWQLFLIAVPAEIIVYLSCNLRSPPKALIIRHSTNRRETKNNG